MGRGGGLTVWVALLLLVIASPILAPGSLSGSALRGMLPFAAVLAIAAIGQTLVIRGMAEAMLDPVVEPYDVAAIKICLEEAGGRFTDLSGRDTIYGSSALSSNGLTHPQVLKAIQ